MHINFMQIYANVHMITIFYSKHVIFLNVVSWYTFRATCEKNNFASTSQPFRHFKR